jgi:hypothetical protein
MFDGTQREGEKKEMMRVFEEVSINFIYRGEAS